MSVCPLDMQAMPLLSNKPADFVVWCFKDDDVILSWTRMKYIKKGGHNNLCTVTIINLLCILMFKIY